MSPAARQHGKQQLGKRTPRQPNAVASQHGNGWRAPGVKNTALANAGLPNAGRREGRGGMTRSVLDPPRPLWPARRVESCSGPPVYCPQDSRKRSKDLFLLDPQAANPPTLIGVEFRPRQGERFTSPPTPLPVAHRPTPAKVIQNQVQMAQIGSFQQR